MLKAFVVLLLSVFTPVALAQNLQSDEVEIESEAVYTMRGNDSKDLARALALFEAKRRAVDTGAKYLAAAGLIAFFGERKMEIYALVAGEVESEVIEEVFQPVGEAIRCFLRIRARVKASDFIKAEIQDQNFEKQEMMESFREDMEPAISKETEPAKELAKAYRLMRKRAWRVGIIYLDRLEVKYPNWGEISMAKAIGYYALHEAQQMKESIEKACDLGTDEACEDLKRLKKVHSLDLR